MCELRTFLGKKDGTSLEFYGYGRDIYGSAHVQRRRRLFFSRFTVIPSFENRLILLVMIASHRCFVLSRLIDL